MREFEDYIDWECISKQQNLSEDFIREFRDRVDWKSISRYQALSENFIREFEDKIDWSIVSDVYQTLSEKFHEKL